MSTEEQRPKRKRGQRGGRAERIDTVPVERAASAAFDADPTHAAETLIAMRNERWRRTDENTGYERSLAVKELQAIERAYLRFCQKRTGL